MQNLSILNKEIKTYNGLFSLNDLHKASGGNTKHQPSNFMRLDTTSDLIEEFNNENNQSSDVRTAVKTIRGGKMPGTYVCKELVYAYAMWISAKFSLLVIRTFDRLQNQQAESQAKLESPYIEGKQLQHIKAGVKRIVHKTGKSYQTVYGGLNHFFGAPNINEIEKGYYEAVCIYLDIPTDFTVPADTMPQSLRQANSDSHIAGLALLKFGAKVLAVQDDKLDKVAEHLKKAAIYFDEARQCRGAIYDGFHESIVRLNVTKEENQQSAKQAEDIFNHWRARKQM